MGELLEAYHKHTKNGAKVTVFEHTYSITRPSLIDGKDLRIIAKAPLKIAYGAPETARALGLSEAKITAEMKFKDALGLFVAIDKLIHQSPELWLAECNFLDDKLTKLGMELLVTGDRNNPSTFRVTAQLFHELAEKDFYLKGSYHGKPFQIRIRGESSTGVIPLYMERNKDKHQRHYTDNYTLQSRIIAKPEEVENHVALLEKALQEWESTVRIKRIEKHGTGWLE